MQCHRQMQSLAANAQAAAAAQAAAVAGLSPQMGGPQRSEYSTDIPTMENKPNFLDILY